MNFQLLSAETMTAISGNWLSRERASIWAITDLVSIRTKIEKAHNDVLSFVVKPGANALQIRLLMDKTDAAKARHDSKSSGLYKMLDGACRATDDSEIEQMYKDIQQSLFPKGLGGVAQTTYTEAAGYVQKLRARVTDDEKTILATISIKGLSGLQIFDQWLEAGDDLGEAYQARLILESKTDDTAISSDQVRKARRAWIEVTKFMMSAFKHCEELSEEQKNDILIPLFEEVTKAEAASKAAKAAPKAPKEKKPRAKPSIKKTADTTSLPDPQE